MINQRSRDPLSLWFDLCNGWLSGQETWIEEAVRHKYMSYSNLFVCGWDFHVLRNEGRKVFNVFGVKRKEKFTEWVPPIIPKIEGDHFLFEYPKVKGISAIHFLKKSKSPIQAHVYVASVEFPMGYLKLIHKLNQIFTLSRVPQGTGVAIHSTEAYFSRITMPLLLPVLGRNAWIDGELTAIMEHDRAILPRILSPKYRYKKHQKVWARVREIMGEEL